jgi:hypothetical protein
VKVIQTLPLAVEKEQFKGGLKLSRVLKQSLARRGIYIIKKSEQTYIENMHALINTLCSFETRLFNTGR